MNKNQLRTALKAYAKGYKVAVTPEDDSEPESLDYKVVLYCPIDEEVGGYVVVTGYFNPSGDTSIKTFMAALITVMEFRTKQMYEDNNN